VDYTVRGHRLSFGTTGGKAVGGLASGKPQEADRDPDDLQLSGNRSIGPRALYASPPVCSLQDGSRAFEDCKPAASEDLSTLWDLRQHPPELLAEYQEGGQFLDCSRAGKAVIGDRLSVIGEPWAVNGGQNSPSKPTPVTARAIGGSHLDSQQLVLTASAKAGFPHDYPAGGRTCYEKGGRAE
jgi:hypothetical protein